MEYLMAGNSGFGVRHGTCHSMHVIDADSVKQFARHAALDKPAESFF
jgi:hypothetical protein